MYLRARKNEPAYKKKDTIGSYRCREEEYEGLFPKKYYYKLTLTSDESNNDSKVPVRVSRDLI